jgi:hypothetical protein
MTFILFINSSHSTNSALGGFLFFWSAVVLTSMVHADRLVDCQPLKKNIELIYTQLFAKTLHPWVYISITFPPHIVDVNVHPTKSEVRGIQPLRFLFVCGLLTCMLFR